ncbi:MAG: prolyl oligopeptidase family serine peptidase [Parasporobacterium sp.]|nr:prolyl oligopeptidase family serine peptidase [Parasporobacterium sp.]
MTVGIILIIIVALLAVFGFYLAHYSMTLKRQTLEETRGWQGERVDISWYDEAVADNYTVRSYDGYLLHAQLLEGPSGCPEGKYAIVTHGHTHNRFAVLIYAKMYLDLGFRVILHDLRGHGENEKTFCTFSIREGRDLAVLIEDTRKRYPDLKVLGIHGESLGGATTIASLKYHPKVDFAVDDCGFSEITSIMEAGLKGMHIPAFFVHIASLCAKIRYGYFFHEMRPVEALRENTVPILFMHGEKDSYIPCSHSVTMQKVTKGYSELHLFPGAEHAESAYVGEENYRKYLEDFLKKLALIR